MLNPPGLVEKGKTCVVATEVRDEAGFHHVGFTAFISRTKTYLGGEQRKMSDIFDADHRSKWNADGSRKVSLEGEPGTGGFASLSAADKKTIMSAFEDLFRRRVRGMKKAGE